MGFVLIVSVDVRLLTKVTGSSDGQEMCYTNDKTTNTDKTDLDVKH